MNKPDFKTIRHFLPMIVVAAVLGIPLEGCADGFTTRMVRAAAGGTPTRAGTSRWVSPLVASGGSDFFFNYAGVRSVMSSSATGSTTQYILKTSDSWNSSSFNTIGNWVTNGTANAATTAPGPGGAYDTGTNTLRTPTNGSCAFAGDSLTLSAGAPAAAGSLMLKGTNGSTVTITNLILAGGVLSQGVNSGSSGIEWVAGNLSVTSNSYVSGLGITARFIGIAANLSGSGSLSNNCNVFYTGSNAAFVGAMIVGGGGILQITNQTNLGGNPASFQAAQLLLNNGTLAAGGTLALNNPNRGITLGGSGGGFTNASGTTLTVSNVITGSGALTFSGSGCLVLAAACTYTGATIISGGSVAFQAAKSGSGNISLANGTALGITASGTAITPAALVLGTSARVTLNFDNITNPAAAPLAAGSQSAGGPVSIVVGSGAFAVGQSYPLLTWTSGTAPAVTLSAFTGATGNLSTNGNCIQLNVTSTNQGPVSLIKFEAESGVLGSDLAISNSTSPAYITTTTNGTGYCPSNATRVATYTVTFPMAGIYELYAHVRVGSGGGDDDSLFYGNGFGVKNPTNSSDWILVNGLFNVGFTAGTNAVTGGGSAGTGVWEWINLSQFAPGPTFTVTNGYLTQTFQIGARETGLDLDAFVFGLKSFTFTVSNLDAGVDGTPPAAGVGTINWSNVLQRIDGFGAGAVFLDSGLDPISSTNMDTLFNTNSASQLGLTLLRIRIDPGTNWTTALADAQKAVARGAGVMATPWTPPAAMKTTNSLIGGSVATDQYANYASYLNNFAGYMKSNGVQLAAVSVQNEPDFLATYESCLWTSNQFQFFFRTNAAAITNAPVMMPESFCYNQNLSEPTLNDLAAATNVAVVGLHLYGGTVADYTNAHSQGIPTWMTEYLVNDQTMDAAVATGEQIHDCLTTGNMSAYVWWKTLGDANGLVNASGLPQKRGFVLAQFSRFVRPGFRRIGTTNTGCVLVTAYRNTNASDFVIVAVNPTAFPMTPTFNLQNFPAAGSVTPWLTSSNLSLAVQSSVTVTNATFTYPLPGLSVATFVGQVNTNNPPVLAVLADQTISAGVTLLLTNAATDADLPAQTLTFSLLGSPTNANLTTLNASNALITWRPRVSQAGTTNLFTVKVADNGAPSLSATNRFTVTVNPLGNPPSISAIVPAAGAAFQLTIAGPAGPDYTLLTSTNLFDWQAGQTSNSPATPFTLNVTHANDPARFYRIKIGP